MEEKDKKPRVYIETSVISYLTSRMSRDLVVAARQEITCEKWPRLLMEYDVVISVPVLDEISKGDREQANRRLRAAENIPALDVTPEVEALAEELVLSHTIPVQYPEDALHVAVAAANGCDFLLTWNFTHLNNAHVRGDIRRIIENQGFESPEICSPEELFGEIS